MDYRKVFFPKFLEEVISTVKTSRVYNLSVSSLRGIGEFRGLSFVFFNSVQDGNIMGGGWS